MSTTNRATPEQIIAHVALLRSVDRLLEQADAVRANRAELEKVLGNQKVKTNGKQRTNCA